MKIVIDIPEEKYNEIHSLKFVQYGLQSEENKKFFYLLINAIQDGTPLPKGHERLIDADALIQYIDEMPSELTTDGRRMIRRVRLTEYIQDTLPTIIKADQEAAE